MSLLGIIALVFGVAGVILTIYEKIWCWPAALISVVVSVMEFYNERLFGDMALNVFYFFSGIYGWYYWNKKKKQNQNFIVTHTPVYMAVPLVSFTIGQSILFYFILSYFKSDRVLFDSVLTAASFTLTFMMAKKWIENWALWVITDAAYVVLYIGKHMYLFAVLYAFFAVIAAYGFYKWKKQLV